MRVISGSAKGRRLKAPRGRRVRPTADRVKEALFNILAWQWEGCRVLDLFAGCGGLGIESLSRGAEEVWFVEQDLRALEALRSNLRACGFEQRARLVQRDVWRFLAGGSATAGGFHVIFADPPYGRGWARRCLEAVARGGWLRPGGRLVVEHGVQEELPKRRDPLVMVDGRVYGGTALSIFAVEAQED